jgi:hypothetical protein
MTSTLDLYRAANVMVKEYGSQLAPQMAARRCFALRQLGHVAG